MNGHANFAVLLLAVGVAFLGILHPASAQENIGCLFSDSLCLEDSQWCFDDYAFGRCLPLYGNLREEDLFRYHLSTDDLHILEKEMQRLFIMGYRWSHSYTQCSLKSLLDSIRFNYEYDPSACSPDSDQDLEGALKAIEGEEIIDPRDLAIVRFTPSISDPHSDYADEVYQPSKNDEVPGTSLSGDENGNGEVQDKDKEDTDDDQPRHNEEKDGEPSSLNSHLADGFNKFGGYYGGNYEMENFKSPFVGSVNPVYKKSGESNQIRNQDDMMLFTDKSGMDRPSEPPYDPEYFLKPGFRKLWRPRAMDEVEDDGTFSEYAVKPVYHLFGSGHFSGAGSPDTKELFEKSFAGTNNLVDQSVAREFLQKMKNLPPPGVIPKFSYQEPSRFSHFRSHNMNPDLLFNENLIDGRMTLDGMPFDAPQITWNEDPPSNYKPTWSERKQGFREMFGPQLQVSRGAFPFSDYDQGINDYDDLEAAAAYGVFPFLTQKFDKKDEESVDYADLLGPVSFQRPERLDVKKPGPNFRSVNNFAFTYEDDPRADIIQSIVNDDQFIPEEKIVPFGDTFLSQFLQQRQYEEPKPQKGSGPEVPDLLLEDEGMVELAQDAKEKSEEKKESDEFSGSTPEVGQEPESDPVMNQLRQSPPASEQHKLEDTYVYITFNDRITDKQGWDISRVIIQETGLSQNYIGDIKVQDDQVLFEIKANEKGVTAAEVAAKAEELKEQIRDDFKVQIQQSGVGTKSSISSVLFSTGDQQIMAAAAIVCGVMAALTVAACSLYMLRQHAKRKAKLQGLTTHDTEASKDYQDLCRARMAGKESGKIEEPGSHSHHGHAPGQRVSSLTKDDNGGSQSSRSSTSSWSEEPVASNMDISTGHMVLSYMEDHLKNKDRLEQEWAALCAYEAEPCAITISAKTDHDPRNPAYIATQGPLPNTATDFWQMVWEQGSVVIVMLTRLTENGHSFCHRYWPEEGSELYHIYEVHLVSEHIWCEDYRVRSFYLKNVRTGETRTVTQFHFLSWPDSGVPVSTKALLEFRRKVNKSYRGRSCPIIVHCSDGTGRSGTYCLIDMVLNRISKGAKEIDIAATLEHIRDQRPGVVKTKAQFEFVLMAVAEEVHAILKALPQ